MVPSPLPAVVPPRLALLPDATLATLGFVIGGVALGTCSGLVPGLHANNVALLLAAVAADVRPLFIERVFRWKSRHVLGRIRAVRRLR